MLQHRQTPSLAPRRVVVLGSRGFVGGNLLGHLLGAGVDVLGLSKTDVDLTASTSIHTLQSLLRPDDALVIVSAMTPDKGRDVATLMGNLQMGQHICAALGRASCAHVVYISSDAVYDDAASPVRESSCASPGSFHGTMHLVRERMLIETLRATGVPLAILRPSLLYGPGDTHNGYGPNRFVRTAVREERIALFGGGEEKRDHVFIDDLSRLIDLVLCHRSSGVLNVATGHAVPFAEVASLVAGAFGGGVPVVASARTTAIAHRHFDVTARIRAFPEYRCTELSDGLLRTIAAARVAAS